MSVDHDMPSTPVSDTACLAAEIVKLRETLQAYPQQKPAKDPWEKLATLSTLFSSLILGSAGLFATYSYNQSQLEQAIADADSKTSIERAKVLDEFSHYIIAPDPQSRQFGYAMFAYLGQSDLALKLIALNKDQAGTAVVETLKSSSDGSIRAAASKLLPVLQLAATLIANFEGLSLKPYQDVAGIWTIGFGHIQGVGPNTPPVTLDEAMQFLGKDIEPAKEDIDKLVKVPLNLNQRAALISFVLGIGSGNFANSALLRALNQGHYDQVPNLLRNWDRVVVEGVSVKVDGLAHRREAEVKLWNTAE